MSSVDFLGAMGAGADIDSKALVEALVAAERAPREPPSIRVSPRRSESLRLGVSCRLLRLFPLRFLD